MIVAVADAGPIIHLAEIESLSVLSAVDELLIPQTVYDELEAGTVPHGLDDISYDVVEADPAALSIELDPGETAALAIATDRSAVLLTDDLEARDAAADLNIEVHGSIGIIVLAYTRDRISKSRAIDLMRTLQSETSLFITDAVVERGVELLEDDA
ncbi:nucleic acid-binding protein [Haloarcula sp. JP-L23]|uniref:nucleic acid-binding protein n=1 Tax=Haloarcula sp. JP-L23 TaxID=2716717 RepID=UPI00140EC102|nr:nucleic acid-binding protein [Haloarcula sp. JP-L23]